MTDSYVRINEKGEATTYAGPDAVNLHRAITLKTAIKLYDKSGIIPTRGMTITKMLALVKQYTSKKYKTTQKKQAIQDLEKWIETMKAAMPIIDDRRKE